MKQKLYNAQQAHQVLSELWPKIKSAMMAGIELEIEVTRVEKSRNQEEMYHSIIGQIAKQAQHLGAQWDAESWKRFLLWQWAKETGRQAKERIVPSLDGTGIVQLGIQSRHFKKDEASEFTEWLLAWAAQNGITLNEVS